MAKIVADLWICVLYVHNTTLKKNKIKKRLYINTKKRSFFACHVEVSLLCTPKGASWSFPISFNYQRCLAHSNMISFWVTNWIF